MRGALLLATALCVIQPALGLEQGGKAPAFDLPARSVRLDDYAGKVVYLDFWASWCGPCKQSFPWLNEMQIKHGAKGLQIIGINLDTKLEDGLRFLATTPAAFTIAFDPSGKSAKQYGIKGMPSSVLIDREGRVAYMHAGFNNVSQLELEKAILAVIGEGR
ncbi:MAG: TlpA family protein disulfide reductase [Rhodocyclaceae bacterium]|nr:MAG: TlpA family protein disulfide reductase [Rhodocyclaceae bacterium]